MEYVKVESVSIDEPLCELLKSVPRLPIQGDGFRAYFDKLIRLGRCFVAEEEGVIRGVVGFYANNLETHEGFLSVLAVDQSLRRQGVGRNLCKLMFDECKAARMEKIFGYVVKDNCAALEFYKSIGFRIVGNGRDEFHFRMEIDV